MISTLSSSFSRLSSAQRLLLLVLAAVPSLLALLWLVLLAPTASECVVAHNSTSSSDEWPAPPPPTPAPRPLTLLDQLQADKDDLTLQLSRLSELRARDAALCDERSANTSAKLFEAQSLLLTQRDTWRRETAQTIASLEQTIARMALGRAVTPIAPGVVVDARWTDLLAATWRGEIPRPGSRDLSVSALESPSRVRALLQHRWIFFNGDSTMRVLFNALLDAVDAPPSARLLYGDDCREFINATDSRDMCRCRLHDEHKDWYDADSGLRISFAWKESLLDDEFDARRLARGEWVAPRLARDTRAQPDVLVVNSGFHALHLQSADESVVFRGERLTANQLLRAAAQADAFVDLLRADFVARGGCAIWRATNTISRADRRLDRALFEALSDFVVPLMVRRGVHVFNATATMSATTPTTHSSSDGLHNEKIAPIWATLLAHAIHELCPLATRR